MNWDEIYKAAEDKGCGEPELKAKDTARWQVSEFMVSMGLDDPEECEIPEESVEDFCDQFNIEFDENGNPDFKTLIKDMWIDFGDVLCDETVDGEAVISDKWLDFPKGTGVEDIWHHFDETIAGFVHGKDLADLMYSLEDF